MHWKLHGPQLAISTACASSLDAIGLAAGMIERGEIEAAIAGGSETLLSPLVYESLVRAGALSRNPDPERASRPFDVERDGFVMGDGAGILVLERLEHAQGARCANSRAHSRLRFGRRCLSHYFSRSVGALRGSGHARRTRRGRRSGEECHVVYAHATSTTSATRPNQGNRRALCGSAADRHLDQGTPRPQHGERWSDVRDRGHHRACTRAGFRQRMEPSASIRDSLRLVMRGRARILFRLCRQRVWFRRSKRVADRLALAARKRTASRALATKFGNVTTVRRR